MPIDYITQRSDKEAKLMYIYTVHVIEEINTNMQELMPSNLTGNSNGLYYQKTVCIGARNQKINSNRSPAFLQEPLLKTNINGSHTFTFKMPQFYYDAKGNKINNDMISYLHNETHLLVQYYENIVTSEDFNNDGALKQKTIDLENLYKSGDVTTPDPNIKTLVFVIKEITEDITGQFFEFECDDIYINELSKIGTQIVMDTELQNNIGSAQDLVNYVLEESDSDWVFKGIENSATGKGFYNYIEQPIVAFGNYKSNGEYDWALFGLNDLNTAAPYLSYYSLTTSGALDLSQYIDEESGLLKLSSGNFHPPVITTGDIYEVPSKFNKVVYQKVTPTALNGFIERIPLTLWYANGANSQREVTLPKADSSSVEIKVFYEYHANFLTPQEKIIYDKKGKQFVTPCRTESNEIIYRKNGYLATDGGFENFVSNPNNFSNTNGWALTQGRTEEPLKVTKTTSSLNGEEISYSCLQARGDKISDIVLENNFLLDTGKKSLGIIKGEIFVLTFKGQLLAGTLEASEWYDGIIKDGILNSISFTLLNRHLSFSCKGNESTLNGIKKELNYNNISKATINTIYYDENKNTCWGKFTSNIAYSQKDIQNIIEYRDKKDNLIDTNQEALKAVINIDIAGQSNLGYRDFRILDFEVYRYVDLGTTWIEPEPISWVSLDNNKKPVMSSDKLLSNYGSTPYYRYYDAPVSPQKKTSTVTNKDLNKVLHYTCQRKLGNTKNAGITLWHLYVIVNKEYFNFIKNLKLNIDNYTSISDYLAELDVRTSSYKNIGGYVQRKKRYFLSNPKLLKEFFFTGAAPNTNNFVFNNNFYLSKFPGTDVIAPYLSWDIDFLESFTKGTKTDGSTDTAYRPRAYLLSDISTDQVGAGTYLCYDSSFNDKDTFTDITYFSPLDGINSDITTTDDIIYRDISTIPLEQYQPIYTTLKVGTVSASNSNAFNIIQKCCETFNCWAHFNVELVSSTLKAPDKFLMRKTISLYDQYYEDISSNFSFQYESNINSIKRVVNSDDITTKTIVQPNNNEYGKNGFCTIQRSKYNLSGENFIYNFKYYIKKKMLDEVTLNRDMYGTNDIEILPSNVSDYQNISEAELQKRCNSHYDDFCWKLKLRIDNPQRNTEQFGYIPTLYRINTKAREIADILSTALTNKDATYAAYLVALEAEKAGEKLKNEAEEKLKNYVSGEGQATMEKVVEGLTSLTSGDVWKMMNSLKQEVDRCQTVIDNQTAIKNSSKEAYEKYNKQYRANLIFSALLEKESLFLQKTFENKYHLYIQEGTWISEDYYDDDKYYLDAASVAYTSGFPKITYTIDVEPLINSQGYLVFGGTNRNEIGYRLEPGHKTFMADREYFGGENNTTFREEVIISETEKYFDAPEKNTLTVQNFRTQFEDLFQRIAATTANLEFAQGMYARAASLINPDGSLQPEALEKTFTNVKSIELTPDSSITTGEQGIVVTNTKTPSEQVYIQGAGIRCTSDGGKTFLTAITGNGINANAITSGSIATDKIYIGNPNKPQMKWDNEGITCFSTIKQNNANYLNYYKFVRLNDLGLYGINQPFVDNTPPDKGYYLRDNVTVDTNLTENDYTSSLVLTTSNLLLNPQCIFYVGWDGFKFKSGSTTSMEGLYFDSNSGLVMRNSAGNSVLQIGPLYTNSDSVKVYGFAIKDANTKKPILFNSGVDNTGRIGIRGKLSILSSESNSYTFSTDDELGVFGYNDTENKDYLQDYKVNFKKEDPSQSTITGETTSTSINFGRQLLALKGGQSLILNYDYNQNYKDGLQIRYGYKKGNNNFQGVATFGLGYSSGESKQLSEGLMTAVAFPEGTYIQIKGYSNAGKESKDSPIGKTFQYGLNISPAGITTVATNTGGATSAFCNFAQRGFAPGVKLQPINCLSNIQSPYLVFQGSVNSEHKGYIMTEDNFICNELFADILTINSINISNFQASSISADSINATDFKASSISALKNNWIYAYDNICFGNSTTEPNTYTIDFNNQAIANFNFNSDWLWKSNKQLLDFGDFNIIFHSNQITFTYQSEIMFSLIKNSSAGNIWQFSKVNES